MEFNDDYEHCIEEVLYFPRNVPTKEAENLYHNLLEGCICLDNCRKETCLCIEKSGTAYKFEDIANLETYKIEEKESEAPTYECSSQCKCCEKLCGNKLVQYGPRLGLEVKLCINIKKGFGLFTRKKLNKGNFICEYAGEILTNQDAIKRFQIYKNSGKMNYIFCINEKFGTETLRTFIDPTVYGNIGRYINHSCCPNSKLVVIREDSTMPVLAVFSKGDIEIGSEITYDYGDDSSGNEEDDRKLCFCGEKACRKYLPYDQSLK